MVNTDAVIVALPPALDPIRLAGDAEKHATILYFGATASLPDEAKTTILESLATAANMFMPFAEETMGTERLGADVPPALVTKLSGRCLCKIRDVLQINPALVTYMGNATQYPQYTPHVTLDFPDFQGEADLKKLVSALFEVRFDRIALWWNDERFEFDLGGRDRSMMRAMNEVSHEAGLRVDNFLEHLGIKGMKWGVRKTEPAASSSTAPIFKHQGAGNPPQVGRHPTLRDGFAPKGTPKEDVDWAIKSVTTARMNRVLMSISDRIGTGNRLIKDNPNRQAIRKENMTRQPGQKASKMAKDHEKASDAEDDRIHDQRSLAEFGISPSGKNRLLVINPMGKAASVKIVPVKPEDLKHEALVGNFLSHHGIKGMKWGIRRNRDSGGDSSGSDKAQAKADKGAEKDMAKMPAGSVVPVKNHDGSTKLLLKKKDGTWKETFVSVDAEKFIRTREKAGHEMSDRELKDALSRANMVENYDKLFGDKPNAELQAKVNAMKLEVDYRDYKDKLNPPKKSMVAKFASGLNASYVHYEKINNITGGALGGRIKKGVTELGLPKTGSSSGSGIPKGRGVRGKPPAPFGTVKPNQRGVRGKTPPIPWGSPPPRSPSFTSPGGVKINQNPLFKPKKSSSGQVFNISDIGKSYNPSRDYPNPFTPQIGTRGGT